ncbi:uncharacterized protein LOC115480995 [Microcaecilia unicolor]|uniref:Uncharacterized protein LOC115480995 n=1 Tax=Microcaecilia unicolor TaxID=1415580 RepID=A0A6P7ZN46_9AMPH|nr:uncharacterized protein LOC115480995 [Microcaecilia unicolor]XP_030075847.1 uncharacterized protein LOC115480995 [Microcaecilia unicolor]XP_030075853.1 uncharacterized protein LOC115480995 [Microcaecilia unicolor]XP_030075859.1 uncharacterized protein LOC115480995 [Microcaecilia unicolor]
MSRERKLARKEAPVEACCVRASHLAELKPGWRQSPSEQCRPKAQVQPPFPFSLLPVDCQLHIFSFLSEVEKCTAALVCTDWSKLIRTPRLWRVADFMRLGPVQSGMEEVLVSVREFERWKKWVHQYAYHLTSRGASLLVLRASFDLGDQKTKWANFLLQFLESIHCGELKELELKWTLTHLKPHTFHPSDSMAQICLARNDQFTGFQTLFERLACSSPKLTKMKLPFDWSEHSVAVLTQFQQLRILELNYFWVFKAVPPETMQKLVKALPNLHSLILQVLVPVKDLGVSYLLESKSLEHLDVSQSRGLVFSYLNLPALKELRIKKTIRGIILNHRTRLALQSRWSCLYDLLKRGTPSLQTFNNHQVLPPWREKNYPELEEILVQSCYCIKHTDTWLL